jgi:predicted RNase H-like HicB family nuclease
MKYLVVFESTGTGRSAYSPDLPGCVSTRATREEVVELHIEGLYEEGYSVPEPSTYSSYVEVIA